ncbi:Heterokaryon incompatibility Het-C [Penicillium paradoxum]|uniref:Heterokaryon incompatibility Het-C n=1 Tax=Penicillium paradoxum TaxID=176176 RepID=UPI002547DDA9|nr:Heterokaryon incompatibility Het-C [Penicillium paradoxum]KAJ5782182.1 Heterokaryon incompatibility Het-C [Penicillium paradoxum]
MYRDSWSGYGRAQPSYNEYERPREEGYGQRLEDGDGYRAEGRYEGEERPRYRSDSHSGGSDDEERSHHHRHHRHHERSGSDSD